MPPGPTRFRFDIHGRRIRMKLCRRIRMKLMACMIGIGAIIWQAPTETAARFGAQEEAPPAAQVTPGASVPTPRVRTDHYGDRLSPGAIRRLGTVRFRHGHPISEVRYSADGKTLISRSWHQSVSFWD